MAKASTITVSFDQDQLAKIRNMIDERLAPFDARWQQVRDLHKPVPTPDSDTVWCDECAWPYDPDAAWPCPTAQLVYSGDEIAALTR